MQGSPSVEVVKFNLDSSTGLLTATDANITGTITATSGSFTGSITSTSGTIGGVSIDGDRLYTGDGEFEDAATAFYLDTDGKFSLGTKFVWDGTDLIIDGEINATTGEIGG
jgi:hypothetical protein